MHHLEATPRDTQCGGIAHRATDVASFLLRMNFDNRERRGLSTLVLFSDVKSAFYAPARRWVAPESGADVEASVESFMDVRSKTRTPPHRMAIVAAGRVGMWCTAANSATLVEYGTPDDRRRFAGVEGPGGRRPGVVALPMRGARRRRRGRTRCLTPDVWA